jgi:hypothetical protein
MARIDPIMLVRCWIVNTLRGFEKKKEVGGWVLSFMLGRSGHNLLNVREWSLCLDGCFGYLGCIVMLCG